jgi:hypothetical protein
MDWFADSCQGLVTLSKCFGSASEPPGWEGTNNTGQ